MDNIAFVHSAVQCSLVTFFQMLLAFLAEDLAQSSSRGVGHLGLFRLTELSRAIQLSIALAPL